MQYIKHWIPEVYISIEVFVELSEEFILSVYEIPEFWEQQLNLEFSENWIRWAKTKLVYFPMRTYILF